MKLTQEKPGRTLEVLHRNQAKPGTNKMNGSDLQKEIDTTYAHTTKIVAEMEKEGLITRELEGRSKYISLTEKGAKVAEKVTELRELTQEQEVEVTA